MVFKIKSERTRKCTTNPSTNNRPLRVRQTKQRFSASLKRTGDKSSLDDGINICNFARLMFETRKDISDLALAHMTLSKYADPSPVHDDARTLVALQKFYASEQRCAEVNLNFLSNAYLGDVTVTKALAYAERFITGLTRNIGIDEVMAAGYFTGGASVHRPRKRSAVAEKLAGGNLASYDASSRFWAGVLRTSDRLTDIKISHAAYCRMAVVPKNEKENRIIAAEAELSLYLQRGIGVALRRRLRRVGCDLKDQQNNRRAAFHASVMGDSVTVDFSAASDSFSLGLINRVCPESLLSLLHFCRAPAIKIDVLGYKRIHVLEKISSMGNGYTFELESLVFLALARAATHMTGCDITDVFVYGDDVVLPARSYPVFQEIMTKLGFLFNKQKTLTEGQLRESCGKYFHRGKDVTPFYIRGPYATILDKYLTLNNLSRWMARTGSTGAYLPLWKSILTSVPREHQRFGCDCMSDMYIALNEEMFCNKSLLEEIGYTPHIRRNENYQCDELKVRVIKSTIVPHDGSIGFYRSRFNLHRSTFSGLVSKEQSSTVVKKFYDSAPEPEAKAIKATGWITKWLCLS